MMLAISLIIILLVIIPGSTANMMIVTEIDYCAIPNRNQLSLCQSPLVCRNNIIEGTHECVPCPLGQIRSEKDKLGKTCVRDPCHEMWNISPVCDPISETCMVSHNKAFCACADNYAYENGKCRKIPDHICAEENVKCGKNELCWPDKMRPFKYTCINVCTHNEGEMNICDKNTEICNYLPPKDYTTGGQGEFDCQCKEGYGRRFINAKCERLPEDVCAGKTCGFNERPYPSLTDPFRCSCLNPCDVESENTCDKNLEKCIFINFSYSKEIVDKKPIECRCKNSNHKKINGVCQGPPKNICSELKVECPDGTKCFPDDLDGFSYQCLDPCKSEKYNICDTTSENCLYLKNEDKIHCRCKQGFSRDIENNDLCLPNVIPTQVPLFDQTATEINTNPCKNVVCPLPNQKCFADGQTHKCEDPCQKIGLNGRTFCPDDKNQICRYNENNNNHECICKDGTIFNEVTFSCEIIPNIKEICKESSCPANQKCYADPKNPLKYICRDPCEAEENLCTGENERCIYSKQKASHICKCVQNYARKNGVCTLLPIDVCENHDCNIDKRCYASMTDRFSYDCLDPCEMENHCMGQHEKCVYVNQMVQCECQGPEYVRSIYDGLCKTIQEIRDENNPCIKLGVVCPNSDEKCFPVDDKDLASGKEYVCEQPCLRSNPCALDEICHFNFLTNQRECKCPEGFDRYKGKCLPIPKGDDICKSESDDRPKCRDDLKCYPNRNNKFEYKCLDPCEIENPCKRIKNQLCFVENHEAVCVCPENTRLDRRARACIDPPKDICEYNNNKIKCQGDTKCYPVENDDWNFVCQNPCKKEGSEICSGRFQECVVIDHEISCQCPDYHIEKFNRRTGKIDCVFEAPPTSTTTTPIDSEPNYSDDTIDSIDENQEIFQNNNNDPTDPNPTFIQKAGIESLLTGFLQKNIWMVLSLVVLATIVAILIILLCIYIVKLSCCKDKNRQNRRPDQVGHFNDDDEEYRIFGVGSQSRMPEREMSSSVPGSVKSSRSQKQKRLKSIAHQFKDEFSDDEEGTEYY